MLQRNCSVLLLYKCIYALFVLLVYCTACHQFQWRAQLYETVSYLYYIFAELKYIIFSLNTCGHFNYTNKVATDYVKYYTNKIIILKNTKLLFILQQGQAKNGIELCRSISRFMRFMIFQKYVQVIFLQVDIGTYIINLYLFNIYVLVPHSTYMINE